jgi:hypothetical protein
VNGSAAGGHFGGREIGFAQPRGLYAHVAADELLAAGLAPRAMMKGLGFDPAPLDTSGKIKPDQPQSVPQINYRRLKKETQMSSAVFETIEALEAARLHFFIERMRPDTITLTVTIVGERIEIDIFEDNHLEISRFRGDESIEGGKELLAVILEGEK